MDRLGTRRLLIGPEGALQYIPFYALVGPGRTDPGNTAAQPQPGTPGYKRIPLIVDHEIVNEPSASALALVITETGQRKPARNTVAVLANPVFDADDPRVKAKGAPQSRVANPN